MLDMGEMDGLHVEMVRYMGLRSKRGRCMDLSLKREDVLIYPINGVYGFILETGRCMDLSLKWGGVWI